MRKPTGLVSRVWGVGTTSIEFMKIIFFGTSEFAVPALEALHGAGFDLTVITMPDKPFGRKKVLTPPPVKIAADKLGIKVLQPPKLKDDTFFEEFKSIAPDFCVVAAYGKIIGDRYISTPKHGFLNIHPSLLPKYRGPTPIQATLLNGDSETGNTIMQIDAEMDHGPILLQKKFVIEPDETFPQLHDRLSTEGAKLLLEVIQNFDTYTPQEQDHSQATFVTIPTREEARIDWARPAKEIYNQIRALNPEPGTWTNFNGKVLNIKSAKLSASTSNGPGVICKEYGHIIVGTTTSGIELLTIQLEGKKETSALEFSHGHPDFVDSKLG